MTPLQKGQFAQFSLRKWHKFAKNDIKLPPNGHGNTENTCPGYFTHPLDILGFSIQNFISVGHVY